MKKIWLVQGTSGNYSERTEWVVEAHTDKAAAEARVVVLGQAARLLETAFREQPRFSLNPQEPDEEGDKFQAALTAREKAVKSAARRMHEPALDQGANYFLTETRLK